ncbi:ARM repeat-containing protein [Cristinia sonorae]|uniref:ARM repeat-containing protein n=1 Tax=Cristinia sonorae TaxID=1940300 RepID=A0A8K0UZE8_9AGAR|nr:ARM repeat-containing protein [Cristinia sonorae]
MDVPFMSSGAMSRAHYALVRKVETAASALAADSVLYAEAETVQSRLQNSTLTLKQIKESLVILLYCYNAVFPGSAMDLQSALPHAISLAEAGKTVQDKRIGYLFCVETMPRNHELQLMLVNTLRKDLESPSISRICLALDTLIRFAPEDVYPAIQDRMYELLSHTSPHIRRRTLLAFRTLCEHNTSILKRILDKMRKRLNDEDLSVVHAALVISIVLMQAKLMSRDHFHPILTKLFRRIWNSRAEQDARALLRKILQTLDVVKPSADDFEIMEEIVRSWNTHSLNATKYQCFLLAAAHPESVQESTTSIFIKSIRHLLVSEDANDLYTFVSCLNCLDPKLWAGSSDIPAVLDGWEVERIVSLLSSEDTSIRKQTLRVLLRVDRSIVEAYLQKLVSNIDTQPHSLSRSFQVIEILCGEDGESYAQHLVHQLRASKDDIANRYILQEAVELALMHIRSGSSDFRSGCFGVLFTILAEQQEALGPTLLTISTALVCEYLDDSLISPEKILEGLARSLPLHPADVQEVCLLAMTRVCAKCESVPNEVVQVVQKVKESAGRHIKRRAEQFINLSQDKLALSQLTAQTRSPTLPSILLALEGLNAYDRTPRSPSITASSLQEGSRPSSRASARGNKLRYAAYDAPKPTPRLRRMSSSSSRSTDTPNNDPDEMLSRTVTAGDLALASGRRDLQQLAKSPVLASVSPAPLQTTLAPQGDLLGLDSPFLSEPQAPTISVTGSTEFDFEKIWTTSAYAISRGWCEVTIDVVVRRLQGMQYTMRVIASDQPPFQGELKVTVTPSIESDHYGIALLRLKESEDDSCLWQMRCADNSLRAYIRDLLTDVE